MNRIMVWLLLLLAAGGCGAERDAAKEAPIDWLARAATVKVGMTRAEVEKILPMCTSTNAQKDISSIACYNHVYVSYPVSGVWSVDADYQSRTNRPYNGFVGTNVSRLAASQASIRPPSDSELNQDRLSTPIWVRKIVKQWPVVMVGTNLVMNEAMAIDIATRYVKEYEPTFDISLRKTTAQFSSSNFMKGMSEKGAWTVDFSIPPRAPYIRKECSYLLMVDRLGRVWGHLTGVYW